MCRHSRLALSSRLLQADLAWQIIPGVLAWDTGKVIIHPSSGFFRTPLNLMSRGAAGNVPQQIPAAAPQWEEGWIGTRLLWMAGDVSLENFFSPRLVWSSDADAVLGFAERAAARLHGPGEDPGAHRRGGPAGAGARFHQRAREAPTLPCTPRPEPGWMRTSVTA